MKNREHRSSPFTYRYGTLNDKISFNASEMSGQNVIIDGDYVTGALGDVVENEDLSHFIPITKTNTSPS